MPSNATETPIVARRLDTPSAEVLADLAEVFEELQTVLRCCERLVAELAEEAPDDVLVEGLWTMALLGYARCFSPRGSGVALGADDLDAALPGHDAGSWHAILLQLRDHHADPARSPRERFTVAVTRSAQGTANGVAVTSARQPRGDDLTVRQTGALAYALIGLVDQRIESQQQQVSEEVGRLSAAELDGLESIDVASDDAGS